MNKADLDQWLNEGMKKGFCSKVLCYSHEHPVEVIPDFFAKDEEEPCWSMVIIRDDEAERKSWLSDRAVIEKIINIICTDGKDQTDGECLDEVWHFLEEQGYSPKQVARKYNRYG